MTQIAPFPETLAKLVAALDYKEWRFKLDNMDRGQGSSGLTLLIQIDCADTYNPQNEITINHYMLVPPASYNEASWKRWLLDQVLLVERHEACEYFIIDGIRPFAPHHGPGNDPYIIWHHGDIQDARTDYLGNKRATDAPNG